MMHKFKVGDRVKCIEVDGSKDCKYIVGKEYTISEIISFKEDETTLVACGDLCPMYAFRFELVQEKNQMASKLINGRPMSELNAEPNRPVVVIGTAVTEAFVVYSTIAFREGEEYYSEWAEILKPEPKPDANGWWKMEEKMPEDGSVVMLCNKNKNRVIGYESYIFKIERETNFNGSWSHWKLWEGPVDV